MLNIVQSSWVLACNTQYQTAPYIIQCQEKTRDKTRQEILFNFPQRYRGYRNEIIYEINFVLFIALFHSEKKFSVCQNSISGTISVSGTMPYNYWILFDFCSLIRKSHILDESLIIISASLLWKVAGSRSQTMLQKKQTVNFTLFNKSMLWSLWRQANSPGLGGRLNCHINEQTCRKNTGMVTWNIQTTIRSVSVDMTAFWTGGVNQDCHIVAFLQSFLDLLASVIEALFPSPVYSN